MVIYIVFSISYLVSMAEADIDGGGGGDLLPGLSFMTFLPPMAPQPQSWPAATTAPAFAKPNATKNVFALFVANGQKPGFWIRRWTWTNTCAQVVAMEVAGCLCRPIGGSPQFQ
jgi:hypothetical protein